MPFEAAILDEISMNIGERQNEVGPTVETSDPTCTEDENLTCKSFVFHPRIF